MKRPVPGGEVWGVLALWWRASTSSRRHGAWDSSRLCAGNNRQPLFVDDDDRRAYLGLLAQVVASHAWHCLSYCLMGNHVHLLLETTEPNLANGFQRIHGPYAQRFNRRHRRTGHLFENRFGSVRVEDDAQLWMIVAYIARNPVEAGLCATLEGWEWSSHAQVLGDRTVRWLAVDRLLAYIGAVSGGDPLARYTECVGLREALAA